jgi:general secretion pathway protein L
MLSFAVEEETVSDPDDNQVGWIGSAADEDVLAVIDKKRLKLCLDALDAAAIGVDEVYCETLLLPRTEGQWSVVWNGLESVVRTGQFEGAATDCGDATTPPLYLQLMLEAEKSRGARAPASIALYTMPGRGNSADDAMEASAMPDLDAWRRTLGVPVRLAGPWDWRMAPSTSNTNLLQERKRWQLFSRILPRLRAAAWIGVVAVTIHSIALITDWVLLSNEQRGLRQQMEARFRGIFPAAVAVVDPALQMRRKLVEARHAAGMSDTADFLPMLQIAWLGLNEFGRGTLQAMSYDNGRMTLELVIDEALARRVATRMQESGLSATVVTASAETKNGTVILVVEAL